MKLSEFAQGKNNNFNLIRISAALAVLVTHSFAIVAGSGDAEPFRAFLGMSIGDVAVDIFFIASGFLVSASLFKRGDLVEFFVSRIYRIFPALWVMLILTVFVIGPSFTTDSLSDYFASRETWAYLVKCGTLVGGVLFNLPGVFEANAYPDAVNGSLWSMPFEVRMYLGLVVLWRGVQYLGGQSRQHLRSAVVVVFLASAVLLVYKHQHASTGHLARLLFMFSCGAAYHVLQDWIRLTGGMFIVAVATVCVAAFVDVRIFFYAYCASVAYMLFYLAYVPAGLVRRYNKLGDYSYGLYIYAFPVQQTLAALFPGIGVVSMIAASGLITFVLAVMSWHLLEERALGARHNGAARVRGLVG